MPSIEELADAAEMIIQGYAFIARNNGLTVINLHRPEHAAFIFDNEVVETTMDEIESFKIQKIYDENKQYLEMKNA